MNKGSTLIEVLISALVAAIFASTFTYLANSIIRSANGSQQITSSLFSAKSMMEEIRSVPYNGLSALNNKSFDNGRGVVHIGQKGSDMLSITVRNKVELNTLRSRY